MAHIYKIACTVQGTEMLAGIFKTRKEALGEIEQFKQDHPTAENVTVIKWECCRSERKVKPTAIIYDARLTKKAGGSVYEAFIAAGWTDELLIREGYMKGEVA
jgi:hypothetical protein